MSTTDRPDEWRVIVNLRAGAGAVTRRWPLIQALLDRYLPAHTVQFTEAPLHAVALAEEAVREGCRQLLAVGGDGTNHEVINGIIRQAVCSPAEVLYGLIPVGTGNDWRRTYGIPKDPEKWIREIPGSRTVLQDVGRLTYFDGDERRVRYFTNVAGLAYDGFVARHINHHPIRNKFGYLLAVFRCLLRYELQQARIEFQDQVIEQYCYTINVGICPYSGGGMRLVPHARPDDGRLALTVAGPVSRAGVVLNTPRFFNGRLDKHPKIDLFQVEKMRVASLDDQPIPLEADGEFLGHTPVEIDLLPRALRVIVPRGYAEK